MSDRTAWWLADAVARHAKYGGGFEIPRERDRDALIVGDQAKLLFEFDERPDGCAAERMWVRVDGKSDSGGYVGSLANTPAVIKGLDHGATVAFESRHVIDIEWGAR